MCAHAVSPAGALETATRLHGWLPAKFDKILAVIVARSGASKVSLYHTVLCRRGTEIADLSSRQKAKAIELRNAGSSS